jgi:hypothetical protein
VDRPPLEVRAAAVDGVDAIEPLEPREELPEPQPVEGGEERRDRRDVEEDDELLQRVQAAPLSGDGRVSVAFPKSAE